jgi:hypothetical protein
MENSIIEKSGEKTRLVSKRKTIQGHLGSGSMRL